MNLTSVFASASLRQKNGGSFRFHLLVICDKKNKYTVQQSRAEKENSSSAREKYQTKDYKEKKKLHEERLRNTKDEPSHYLLKQYYTGEIGKKGTKGLVTHIDVVRFKALWEEHLRSDPESDPK